MPAHDYYTDEVGTGNGYVSNNTTTNDHYLTDSELNTLEQLNESIAITRFNIIGFLKEISTSINNHNFLVWVEGTEIGEETQKRINKSLYNFDLLNESIFSLHKNIEKYIEESRQNNKNKY